jgi:predicted sulfurtransferase
MRTIHSISISTAGTFLVASAGVTAHDLNETHLSSGYARILTATFQSKNLEHGAPYIHDARVAVRIDKDRDVEAKLESCKTTLRRTWHPHARASGTLLTTSSRSSTAYKRPMNAEDSGRRRPEHMLDAKARASQPARSKSFCHWRAELASS